MVEVLVQAHRLLPTVLVDLLLKISMAVQQRYRAEIEIKVARGLAMVARENSETAGIIRHRLVEPELRRKIGDAWSGDPEFSISVSPPHVGIEFLIHSLHLADVVVVGCKLQETSLAGELQHPDWIMIGSIPEFGV